MESFLQVCRIATLLLPEYRSIPQLNIVCVNMLINRSVVLICLPYQLYKGVSTVCCLSSKNVGRTVFLQGGIVSVHCPRLVRQVCLMPVKWLMKISS